MRTLSESMKSSKDTGGPVHCKCSRVRGIRAISSDWIGKKNALLPSAARLLPRIRTEGSASLETPKGKQQFFVTRFVFSTNTRISKTQNCHITSLRNKHACFSSTLQNKATQHYSRAPEFGPGAVPVPLFCLRTAR